MNHKILYLNLKNKTEQKSNIIVVFHRHFCIWSIIYNCIKLSNRIHLSCPYVFRSNKLSVTFLAQMFNSHCVQHKISFNAHFIIIRYENFTDTLDIFFHSGVISNRVCGFRLSVSIFLNAGKLIFDMLNLLSDYDLSLICTSECDDEYFKCVSTCGSSDCFMDCNRATVICIEGKYAAYCMVTGPSPVSDSIQIISCLKS